MWTGILALLKSVLELFTGSGPSRKEMDQIQGELDRERKITAALRQRIVAKEARIRELEKSLAERDPGALLDSVFAGPASPKA